MNRVRLLTYILSTVAIGIAAERHSAAQLGQKNRTTYAASSGILQQRLVRLISELSAKGDTNTLTQVTDLLSAKDVLQHTVHLDMTVALLERLRTGQTNEVIELLESGLDGALIGIANHPKDVSDVQVGALEMARAYRERYPRRKGSPDVSAAVARAFDLLEAK